MTPIDATTALAIFGAAAILLDAALLLRDAWRRRGVLATGSTPSVDAQSITPRGGA